MSALFTGEAYFCPKCGSILPLPEVCDIVKCRTCSYQQKASLSEQAEYSSVVICVPSRGDDQSREMQSEGGPYVDRVCQKCGHDKMSYYTQQTRSADEGQTVFYRCPKCTNQETEHS